MSVRRTRIVIASLLVSLAACDEELAAAPADAGADGPIEKADGALCPPPLGSPSARPTTRPAAGPLDHALRMNHLQAKATHNSYHVQMPEPLKDLAYTHEPIDVQLERQGVRALEIDLHFDHECGRHEVFHVPLIDDVSTCSRFTDCLGVVRTWSDAHLGHHPLLVQIEPKDDSEEDTALRLDVIEKEILSVFPRDAIITPDEVKGDAPTLASAVANGWPTLGETRGRVLFYMLASRAMRDEYTHGGKDLSGRLMFVSSSVGEPFASIAVIDDPIARRADVDASVAAGVIVRTFAETSSRSTARRSKRRPRSRAGRR